ncbi:DUF6461 domain-containing protein [Streptomyces sp. NPDC006638]|uniref:DUF6461 domain-containing protein n=1 Tax=Streptomyces sp. NPDC006638 TaxID=3157183 RepID=UPI0033B2A541
MISATAADYGWIRSPSSFFRYALEGGYTLTLVRGVSPAELLEVAGAEPRGACDGLVELIEQHADILDGYEGSPESFLAGAFSVPGEGGDWTLALEFGGDLGTRPSIMEALSTGTQAVSHSSNGGKPMHFFHWYEDGELRTTFEWPTDRTGSTPDELNDVNRLDILLATHQLGDEAAQISIKFPSYYLHCSQNLRAGPSPENATI